MLRYKGIKQFYSGQIGFISKKNMRYRFFSLSSLEVVIRNMVRFYTPCFKHIEKPQNIKIEGDIKYIMIIYWTIMVT